LNAVQAGLGMEPQQAPCCVLQSLKLGYVHSIKTVLLVHIVALLSYIAKPSKAGHIVL